MAGTWVTCKCDAEAREVGQGAGGRQETTSRLNFRALKTRCDVSFRVADRCPTRPSNYLKVKI
jgi:hypothetical protein